MASVLDEVAEEIYGKPAKSAPEGPQLKGGAGLESAPALATRSVLEDVAEEVFGGKPPKEPEPGILSKAASAVSSAFREGVSATPIGRALGFQPTGPAVAEGAAAPPKDVALPQIPTPEALKATRSSAAITEPTSVEPSKPIPIQLAPMPQAVREEVAAAPLLERVAGISPSRQVPPVPEKPAPGGMLGRAAAAAGIVSPEAATRRATEQEFAETSVMRKPEGMSEERWAFRQAIEDLNRVTRALPQAYVRGMTGGIVPAIYRVFGIETAPEPKGEAEGIASGAGELAGFIAGPAKVAHGLMADNVGKMLAPKAGDAVAMIFARNVANQAATLGLASVLAHTGEAATAESLEEAARQTVEHAKGGVMLGAAFGGLQGAIPSNALMGRAARLGVGLTVLDAVQGVRPWDDRATAQKAFDYGLNIFFLWKGQDAAAMQRLLAAEAQSRGKGVTPEQVLKSVLDKAQERAAKVKPGEESAALEAELKNLFAQEVGDVATGMTATELRSAREVAEQKTGGPAETRMRLTPPPARPIPMMGQPVILGPTGRPMEAPAPPETAPQALQTAQERAATRAAGLPLSPAQVAPQPPTTAQEGRKTDGSTNVGNLTFRDYVQAAGQKWPITSRDPNFARLRAEFDDMRKGLYEARQGPAGQWAVVNRKTGEEVDHLPTGAKAQLEANRLSSVVTLDKWREAQLPTTFRIDLPGGQKDLAATKAPEPKLEPGTPAAAAQQTERATVEGPKPSAEPPAPAAMPTPASGAVVKGKQQEIRVPAGSRYQTEYQVIEAEDLIPSHNPRTFARDPRYPEGVQNRPYHSDKSEQAKVIRQGQDFEPLFLVSPQPGSGGTPIVAPDSNVVLSGNSRTMSLLRTLGTKDFERYRAALAEMTPVLGLRPESLDGLKNPVLVRRLMGTDTTPEFYRRFAAETNQGFKGPLSRQASEELGRVAEEKAPYEEMGVPAGSRPTEARRAGVGGGESMKSPQEAPPRTQAVPSQVSIAAPPSASSATRETAPSDQIISMAPTSIPSLTQPTSKVQELLQLAERAKPGFQGVLEDIVSGIPGAAFLGARVKALDKAVEKLQRKADRDANSFHDYLGGRIQANTPETLTKVAEAIRARFGERVEQDFLEIPNDWGYRADHFGVKTPSGLIAEIQLVPEPIANYQAGPGWPIYSRWRAGEPETMPMEQFRQRQADQAESRVRYQEAYDQWTGQPSRVAEPEAQYERPPLIPKAGETPPESFAPRQRRKPATDEPRLALEEDLLFAIRGGAEGPPEPSGETTPPKALPKEVQDKLRQYGAMIFAESPARSFPDFARRITERLGPNVRPYLPEIWGEVLREAARTQQPLPGGQTISGTGKKARGAEEGIKPPVPPKEIQTSAKPIDPPPGLTEPQLKLGIHKDVLAAAEDLFKAGKIVRDPKTLLSDQILDAIRDGTLRIEDMASVLDRRGMTFAEFGASLFRPAITDAARRMGALGQLQRRLNELERELGVRAGQPPRPGKPGAPGEAERLEKIKTIGDILDAAKVIDPRAGKTLSWWRRADNIRRGMLVTQLATSVRNFTTQVGRLGLDVLEQGLEGALQRAFGKEVTTHPADSMRALMEVFSQFRPANHRVVRQRVDAILEGLPREQERLFGNYASDLNRAAKAQGSAAAIDKALSAGEKAVDVLNIFNRFQEYVVRRSVFQGVMAGKLRARGIDLEEVLRDPAVRRKIPVADIREAIEKSLEITFASNPAYGSTGYHFIKWVNKFPGATFQIPFPRFMTNSLRFLFEFSPLGFTKMLSKAEQAKFQQGDMKTISRATLGLGLLGTAYLIRSMQEEDTRWNEIRLPGMERTIDVRPLNPFASYLFVADVLHRIANDRLYGGNLATETIKNVLGANVRGGTGLQMVDQLVDGLRDIGDARALTKYLQGAGGHLVSGLLTPLQQLTDVYAQFDPEAQIIRNVRERPFAGPILQRFPSTMVEALGVELPSEKARPTSAEPAIRESPGIRQMTGLTMFTAKNDFERELDRLQIPYREILPSQGDARLDNLLAKHMGPLAEEVGSRLVSSHRYERLGEIGKRLELKAYLQRLRKQAKAKALLDRDYREISREVKAGTSKERLAEIAREERAGLR